MVPGFRRLIKWQRTVPSFRCENNEISAPSSVLICRVESRKPRLFNQLLVISLSPNELISESHDLSIILSNLLAKNPAVENTQHSRTFSSGARTEFRSS